MTRLTTEELEVIRKRADAATEGPWDYDIEDLGISNGNFMVLNPEDFEVCGEPAPIINAKIPDITFICEARTDIPKLLAEVEYLTGVIGTLRSKLQLIDGCTYGVPNELTKEAIEYANEEIR